METRRVYGLPGTVSAVLLTLIMLVAIRGETKKPGLKKTSHLRISDPKNNPVSESRPIWYLETNAISPTVSTSTGISYDPGVGCSTNNLKGWYSCMLQDIITQRAGLKNRKTKLSHAQSAVDRLLVTLAVYESRVTPEAVHHVIEATEDCIMKTAALRQVLPMEYSPYQLYLTHIDNFKPAESTLDEDDMRVHYCTALLSWIRLLQKPEVQVVEKKQILSKFHNSWNICTSEWNYVQLGKNQTSGKGKLKPCNNIAGDDVFALVMGHLILSENSNELLNLARDLLHSCASEITEEINSIASFSLSNLALGDAVLPTDFKRYLT